jgi:hypothetical protein
VPENVHVRVQLPEQGYATAAPAQPNAAYTWGERAVAQQRQQARVATPEPDLFPAYSAPRAPEEVAIEGRASVRRISVRTGAAEFTLSTSRELSVTPGTTRRIAILAEGEPLDIVMELPAGVRDFLVRVPGGVAFAIRAGVAEVNCAPATSQVLRDGTRWIDITPDNGILECR